MMTRRGFGLLPFAAKRPNVLILLADDLGSADLGYCGGEIATPNLDKLARESLSLEQAYACPVCSPTRASLMTGRSPMRYGVMYHVIRPWLDYGVPLGEHFLPESFQAAGYQTAITGKWHLGHSRKAFLPNARGFQHAYGHVNGAIDYFTHERDGGLDWHRNGKAVREEGYSTDLIAREAAGWLARRDRAKPFFLYVPFNAPHSPLQAPAETLKKYASIADPKRRAFAAMVDRLDTAVGQILAAVDDENTIVVFSSDNGGPLNFGARNGKLRGAKGSVYEGGIRTPMLLRWPGQVKPGTTKQVATVLDLFPTLAAAAGVKPLNKLPFDGRNLWPALRAGKTIAREDLLVAVESGRGLEHTVRRGNWKLVRIIAKDGSAANELFDLAADPEEREDLAAREPKRTAELAAVIDRWRALYPPDGVRSAPENAAGRKAPPVWIEAAR